MAAALPMRLGSSSARRCVLNANDGTHLSSTYSKSGSCMGMAERCYIMLLVKENGVKPEWTLADEGRKQAEKAG